MKDVPLIVLILAFSAVNYSCTNKGNSIESIASSSIPFPCPAGVGENEVLVIVHYFDDTDGEDGPSFANACAGKNHTAELKTTRKIIVDEPKPPKESTVIMRFQLDSSIADHKLKWRPEGQKTDEPVWMVEDAAAGEVPTPDSWCAGTPKAFTVDGPNLSFLLCKDDLKRKRHAIQLRLFDPATPKKDIRVDPQVVHRQNTL